MNINQALKEKNRLAGKLKKLDERMSANSHWVTGSIPPYNIKDLINERRITMEELIDLKSKIATATLPVMEDIIFMAELKAYISVLKGLDLAEGHIYERYSSSIITYQTTYPVVDRDKLVENLENDIAKLQDKLDAFNATTTI